MCPTMLAIEAAHSAVVACFAFTAIPGFDDPFEPPPIGVGSLRRRHVPDDRDGIDRGAPEECLQHVREGR